MYSSSLARWIAGICFGHWGEFRVKFSLPLRKRRAVLDQSPSYLYYRTAQKDA